MHTACRRSPHLPPGRQRCFVPHCRPGHSRGGPRLCLVLCARVCASACVKKTGMEWWFCFFSHTHTREREESKPPSLSAQKKMAPLPVPVQEFVAGGLAGLAAVLVGQPLDTVRVTQQAAAASAAAVSGAAPASALATARALVARGGGAALWRGVVYPVATIPGQVGRGKERERGARARAPGCVGALQIEKERRGQGGSGRHAPPPLFFTQTPFSPSLDRPPSSSRLMERPAGG